MTSFADLTPGAKKELWSTLALRHACGIGVRRAKSLAERFGSALNAVEADMSSPDSWGSCGIPRNTALGFASGNWRGKAKAEWAAIQAQDCRFLLWNDAAYPEPLRQIIDAPLLLYHKGNVSLLNGPAVGVVGARNCTRAGMRTTSIISRGLSRAGVTVVSGMARGIDRVAHLAGLEGPGGSVAVLGTGIDVAYPACNADLCELLGNQGLIISEFPPGTLALSKHFPVRNRLISGLSQGVLVVEAARRSGSLITARLALEQNREVFVVPGPAFSSESAGCQELLRSAGAHPVFETDDILWQIAPQLNLEAQRSLEKHRLEQEQAQAAVLRDPARDGFFDELNNAEPAFPPGALPWIAAPSPSPGKPQKKTTRGNTPQVPVKDEPSGQSLRLSSARMGRPQQRELPVAPVPDASPDACPPAAGNQKPDAHFSGDEGRIMAELSSQKIHIDDLARGLDMDIGQLSGLLAMLEVRGLVRRAPGMLYSLP